MPFFGGDMQKRLKCEKMDGPDGLPRLVCRVYVTDEEGNTQRVIASMTIVKTDEGLEFEDIDADAGSIDEIKQLVSKTLRTHRVLE